MSDKVMHILAYLGLVFLVWLAINPYERVRWNQPKVWMVLAVIVLYGIMDEVLQGWMGRSADEMDFLADIFGSLLGLGILSIFSFWPALLLIAAIFIFCISNLARIDLLNDQPFLNTGFHFLGYAFFTLVWIQYIGRTSYKNTRWEGLQWIGIAMTGPFGLLIAVKLTELLFDRRIWAIDCALACFAIVCSILFSWSVFRCSETYRSILFVRLPTS
ncbi:MAG: VanZ family protein [Sedimentisphaerales bacterium]|nr:VanZ family protein [Sedimentisphaerales bacterium]